mmetsp:Transcript_28910/g.51586  ORF Transcript_28910/g.51586 Transcript_28910/m.51586 type:complete len:339 (-) Transcript_28910:2038-3054(-)
MNVEKALKLLTQDSTSLQSTVKEMANSGLNHYKKLMLEVKNIFGKANGIRKEEDEAEGKGVTRLTKAFDLMTELLLQLPAGGHSFNIHDFKVWMTEVLELEFNSLDAKVTRPVWNQLKTIFINELLVLLKTLSEIAGRPLGIPAYISMLEELYSYVDELNDNAVECLTASLQAIGALAAPLATQYAKKVQLTASIRAKIMSLQTTGSVTLEPAKKLRTRKVGNSHQRRSHKVKMRKDEKRKLVLLGPKSAETHEVDLNSLRLQLQFLSALICTRTPIDLTDLIIVDLDKLDPFILKPLVRALYLHAQLDNSHKHFTIHLLQKLQSRRAFKGVAQECEL